jgi:hypothetical protein
MVAMARPLFWAMAGACLNLYSLYSRALLCKSLNPPTLLQ